MQITGDIANRLEAVSQKGINQIACKLRVTTTTYGFSRVYYSYSYYLRSQFTRVCSQQITWPLYGCMHANETMAIEGTKERQQQQQQQQQLQVKTDESREKIRYAAAVVKIPT